MDCCAGASAVSAQPPLPLSLPAPAPSALAAAAAELPAAPFVPLPQSVAVRVVVRIRPQIAREAASSGASAASSVLEVTSPTSLTVADDPTGRNRADAAGRAMTFDAVLGSASTQLDAYNAIGAGVLLKVLQGFNGCVFAYGQTASGKTFTMEGAASTNADAQRRASAASSTAAALPVDAASSAGVIPRMCADLCERLEAEAARTESGDSWSLNAQYIEIYQEQIRDLLAAPRRPTASTPTPASAAADDGANIRQRLDGTIFLEGVNTRVVRSPADIAALLVEGQARRTRGETAMNLLSSRSHAVLTLSLALVHTVAGGAGGVTETAADSLTRECKLHLVDLAGSERADSTGATGARLKEGAKINLSLSALGNVIAALTTTGRAHVPYRDSKLTRLLQDSLGGSSVTAMVACVSPALLNYDETLATLRFAQRAKLVTNQARVAVDAAAARLSALLDENAALRRRIAALEAAAAAAAVPVASTLSTSAAAQSSGGGCVIA